MFVVHNKNVQVQGGDIMEQFIQIQNNLRQVRQELNNTLNQINQKLINSEQMIQSMSSQVMEQNQFSTQYGTNQYSRSQYNPNQFQNSSSYTNQGSANRNNINPISGLSENKPTMRQQAGVNKYGATYSSGNDYGQ